MLEELRIIAPAHCCVTLWQHWLGISWDARSLQLMLGFSSLLSLSPTSHVPTGACTLSKDAPVHPPHHELEECPVIISQKFLIEAAEHLRRSKGRLSSVEIAMGASQLADMPRTRLHIQLGPLGCPEGLGSEWVLLGLCWSQ